jgi:cytochrome c biogenesis protein CcmG/thiol:disulfide interchange protein DsbE
MFAGAFAANIEYGPQQRALEIELGKNIMHRLVLLAILSFAATTALAVDQGDVAPPWKAMDFSGNEVSFPEVINGKPTVVVFWATWCPYCNAFMPNLGNIQKDYGEEKINVIVINAKERGHGDPAAYVDKLDFKVIGVAEGDAIADAYSVRFIPGLMIVDSNGILAWERASTELPAGKSVAEFWEGQVREQLDLLLAAN